MPGTLCRWALLWLPGPGLAMHVASVPEEAIALYVGAPFEGLREDQARHEEGLPRRSSKWLIDGIKIPRSWVQKVERLNHRKLHRYNFQGTTFRTHARARRLWILPFARENFTLGDVFRLTDDRKELHGRHYVPMGEWDATLAPSDYDGYRVINEGDFHKEYFQVLAQSELTLCPGGDTPYSARIYEAALARSICVIDSFEQDVDGHQWSKRIPYMFYHRNSSCRYNSTVAQHNFDLFVRYQTYVRGNDGPPVDGHGSWAPGCGPSNSSDIGYLNHTLGQPHGSKKKKHELPKDGGSDQQGQWKD